MAQLTAMLQVPLPNLSKNNDGEGGPRSVTLVRCQAQPALGCHTTEAQLASPSPWVGLQPNVPCLQELRVAPGKAEVQGGTGVPRLHGAKCPPDVAYG